jgi:hypothetical protein
MYRCNGWAPALLLIIVFAMQSTASKAEPRIGVAASTRPNAEGIVGANSEKLSPGSELYANETVRTGNRGQADLVLLDDTNLIVGPTSEVLLDKFVYDRTGSSGSVVLRATRGTLRVVTGSQDRRAYRVNTPYGSLGVSESLANFVKDISGEVTSPPGTSTRLSLAEENDLRGTTNASGGTTVEVVVARKGEKLCQNGRPPQYGKPCEVECNQVMRLAKGKGFTYTDTKGKRHEVTNENEFLCQTPGGDVVRGTSTESILSFEVAEQTPSPSTPTTPPSPPTTPCIPTVSLPCK